MRIVDAHHHIWRRDDLTWLSLRNVASIHLLAADQLNTYDVLRSDDVVFTRGAFDAFVASSTARGTATVAEPASEPEGATETDPESVTTQEAAQ